MTRPDIIRADSIDLQDRDAPSAQDHSQRVNQAGPKAPNGVLAPHQAETLREVAAETAEERRVSWNNGDIGDLQLYAEDLADGVAASLGQNPTQNQAQNQAGARNKMGSQQQDALAIAQNGGLSGTDVSEEDLEGDGEDLDDDMMDKISSSPSIEDGGSCPTWPRRVDSLRPPSRSSYSSSLVTMNFSEARSSSPYLDQPEHLPLTVADERTSKASSAHCSSSHHHLQGEYSEEEEWLSDSLGSINTITCVTDDEHSDLERGDEDFANIWLDSQSSTGARGSSDVDNHYEETRTGPSRKRGGNLDSDEGIDLTLDDDLTIPYDGSDEDDDDEFSFSDVDPRYIDSGWGGECLQNTEDIDFEFVYALHTFVATVEGQANATKGDTMVLLDDSNSYWWLVRVVKDSSIGYLPAEHIETPTERLARLNKHRNIDLSATMLGDQAEKSKNPIKSAMRRRKAKTVTFAAPTYVDYSDIDYSTEEEDLEAEYFAQQQQQQQQQAAAQQADGAEDEIEDETAKVEPLKPKSEKEVKIAEPTKEEANGDGSNAKFPNRTSEEIFETSKSETPGPTKTKDGTVRDSFFKDDTVETKKITLTPNLLRDDGAPRASTESKDLKQRPSLDKLDKDSILGKDDKKKKDKKDKDKKAGGFRSIFSRKDKKRSDANDDDSFGKRSMEMGMDGAEREVDEMEDQPSPEKSTLPQRNPSKLQKQQPRTEPSPTRKSGAGAGQKEPGMDLAAFLNEGKLNNVANVPPATMRVVDSQDSLDSPPKSRDTPSDVGRSSSISKIIPSRMQNGESRPQKVVKAKSRVELDDFDSLDEETPPEPQRQPPAIEERPKQQQQQQPPPQQPLQRPTIPGAYPDSYLSTQTVQGANVERQTQDSRLADSPVQLSPVNSNNPPPLTADTSSQDEDRSSPISSPSPELIEREDAGGTHRNQDSITTSTSATTTSTWNDANLRAFFDSSSDIRDMLVVVYDKSDVEPAGPDHPVVGGLFREENAKLAEITTQLDNMLGDWLARKQRLRGTV